MSAVFDFSPGTEFASDFRLERLLGKGGMGAVYVAHQHSTGRKRALKLMHPSLLRDETLRVRFEREARVGSQIRSDHVVEVIAGGIDAPTGMPWLAMELLEGEDLLARVGRAGPLSLAEAEAILAQVCHALAAAHEVGVVHRDLKPENIFLATTHRDGAPVEVKVLDFGIAKMVAESNLTQTGVLGTPLWMAPEQTGGTVTPATDVWALGLLGFWMLTGRFYWLAAQDPSRQTSLMAVLHEIGYEPLVPASERAAALGCAQPLPAGFDTWFARCVEREPAARFADAGAARAALSQLSAGVASTIASGWTPPAAAPSPYAATQHATTQPSAPPPSLLRAGAPASASTPAPETATTAEVHAGGPRRRRLLGSLLVAGAACAAVAIVGARRLRPPSPPRATATAPTTASAAPAPPPRSPATQPAAQPAIVAGPAVDGGNPGTATAAAPPAPRRLAVDQDDSKTVWKIPVGDSPVRGPSDALVTIVEFGNFQCPFSKGVERKLKDILAEHPKEVRLVWKDDPLAIHSLAEGAVQLAREARAQRGDAGFWSAHDALLDPDLIPSPANLVRLARKLGLHVSEAIAAVRGRRYQDDIATDLDLADEVVTQGTPYFFVNGRRVHATGSLDQVRAAVDEELARGAALAKSGVKPADLYDRITSSGEPGVPLERRRIQLKSVTNPTLGTDTPSVVLLEFCSWDHFLCRLVAPTVDGLLARYRDRLMVVWVDVAGADASEARDAAIAARYAFLNKGQAGYRKMRRLLLEGSATDDGLSPDRLEAYGRQVGMHRGEMSKSLKDPDLHGALDADIESVRQAKITKFPSFLVCGAELCSDGGYYVDGAVSLRSFEKRIRAILDGGGKVHGERPR